MLDKITNLVRQYAGDAIKNNAAIPGEKSDEAITDAATSIVSGFKTAIANGNISKVTDFFNGGKEAAAKSPIETDIEVGYANNLMQKFGLNSGVAGQLAGTIIPIVLKQLVSKANDPGDSSFDVKSIIASLAGGNVSDLMGKFGGGNKGDDGGMLGKMKGFFN